MALSGELHFRLSLHHPASGDSPTRFKSGSSTSSTAPGATATGTTDSFGASAGNRNTGDLSDISASTLNAVGSTGTDFRRFLNTDVDLAAQRELFKHQLQSLQALKRVNRIRNQHEQTYTQTQLTCDLALAVQEQQHKVKAIHQRLSTELHAQQGASDTSLMSSILQYNSLLQRELIALRDGVVLSALEASLQRRQAQNLKEIRVFAHRLFYETKGKISVTSLAESSSQFKRCSKAVKENISSSLLVNGYSDVCVKHVLKVEHTILSQQMQKGAARVEDGKVKGLFCVLPPGGLQALCVYGLHVQSLFPTRGAAQSHSGDSASNGNKSEKPIPAIYHIKPKDKRGSGAHAAINTDSRSSNNGRGGYTGTTYLDQAFPTLFQISWLWADGADEEGEQEEGEEGERGEGERGGERGGGYIEGDAHAAEKIAKESAKAFAKMGTTATTSSSSKQTCSFLRFSKSSTASGIDMLAPQDAHDGCYIALCRVLMARLHTINGPLSDAAAREAYELGCDSLYSTIDQEYILLRPQFVLPEFVMFMQMLQPADSLPIYHHPEDRKLHTVPEAWLPASLAHSSASAASAAAVAAASASGAGAGAGAGAGGERVDLDEQNWSDPVGRQDSRGGGGGGGRGAGMDRTHVRSSSGDRKSEHSTRAGVIRRRDAVGSATDTQGLFYKTTADVLIDNSAANVLCNHSSHTGTGTDSSNSNKSGVSGHWSGATSAREFKSPDPHGRPTTPTSGSSSSSSGNGAGGGAGVSVDHRMIMMQKQSLILSIQGSTDDFVRHMRDITRDRLTVGPISAAHSTGTVGVFGAGGGVDRDMQDRV